jgi:hypothetical protein
MPLMIAGFNKAFTEFGSFLLLMIIASALEASLAF